MAHPITLPTLGILALLGTGAGVHLGRSAIAEINPAYFDWSERSSSFYADLTPQGSSHSAPQALSAGDEQSYSRVNCIGCNTYPEEYRPLHDPAVDGFESIDAESSDPSPVQFAVDEREVPVEIVRLMADRARMELYARAPTTAEEQVEYASIADEAAAERTDEETGLAE